MKFPQKMENDVPQDSTTYVFLGIHQKDSTSYYRDTWLCMLVAALLAIPDAETSLDVYKVMGG